MTKENLLKNIVSAIGVIKNRFEVKVIKDYVIPPLVNLNTKQEIGFAVKLLLNTKYDYDEEMLTDWKRMLNADEWYISVKRNQLHIIFKVRYKEEKAMRLERRIAIESVIGKLEVIKERLEELAGEEMRQFESLTDEEKEAEEKNDRGDSIPDYISDIGTVTGSMEDDIKLLKSIIER